jgi:hypothetical protein
MDKRPVRHALDGLGGLDGRDGPMDAMDAMDSLLELLLAGYVGLLHLLVHLPLLSDRLDRVCLEPDMDAELGGRVGGERVGEVVEDGVVEVFHGAEEASSEQIESRDSTGIYGVEDRVSKEVGRRAARGEGVSMFRWRDVDTWVDGRCAS